MKEKKVEKDNVNKILNVLSETYPNAHCELNFRNPFELLISTILSAQSTDRKVNQVTERLFQKYKTPEDFANLNQEDLEIEIKEIGLYRNKAKNIISMCQQLIMEHNGQVPNNMNDLISLPGVGRKTANVVLSNAFGIPAIAVDTHVFRVSNRIGLAISTSVDETEKQLMECIPKEKWSETHHLLIWHGRRICEAKKPKCEVCPIAPDCNYYISNNI